MRQFFPETAQPALSINCRFMTRISLPRKIIIEIRSALHMSSNNDIDEFALYTSLFHKNIILNKI